MDWPSLSEVGEHASWMMHLCKCNMLTGWTLKLGIGEWRASLTDHAINQHDFFIYLFFLMMNFLDFILVSVIFCYFCHDGPCICGSGNLQKSINTYLENDRKLHRSSKKTEMFKGNLLLRVLSMLFQLQHVQNRAIPKPSFNRVFQEGTGRGTNASIQWRPKC